jgi:hypothetical protein
MNADNIPREEAQALSQCIARWPVSMAECRVSMASTKAETLAERGCRLHAVASFLLTNAHQTVPNSFKSLRNFSEFQATLAWHCCRNVGVVSALKLSNDAMITACVMDSGGIMI